MITKANGLAVKSKVKGGHWCINNNQTVSAAVNGLAVKSKVKGGHWCINNNQSLSR